MQLIEVGEHTNYQDEIWIDEGLRGSQLTFTYSKSRIEALEKGVKYVQS